MSAKNMDEKGRWRSRAVSFRMSEAEWEQLDTFVSLSGLSKQDYMIRRALHTEIRVIGSPRVYKALRNELKAVCLELERIEAGEGVDDELLQVIRQITVTLDGLKEDANG